MRLTPGGNRDNFKFLAIGVSLFIIIVSVLSGIVLGQGTATRIRTQLNERSQSIAAALGPQEVGLLKGEASDGGTQTYKDLKVTLANVKKGNPDARSVYLMGTHNSGKNVFFFVDSEDPSSSQYSPAADPYDDGTDADHTMFVTPGPFVEGPVSDSYGTFISGLAPIYKPGTHDVLAVLGMDVDASDYWKQIIYSGMVPVLAGAVVVVIIFAFESMRRRNLQLLALRSELVSLASHELRNPITGIRWAADSLRKMVGDDTAGKMAKAIYDSAVRLQSSTDDILELSHAMNSRALNLVPTDLSKLMREVVEIQQLSAQQKAVTIEFSPSWPAQLMVTCDADQIKRALHNVVSNAIKYTGNATTVSISYKFEDNMHNMIITDQGIGIPETEQAKVWRGFYRASNAVRSNIPGTGLGLYLVKAVFTRHGGRVSFTSVQNQGSTFILSLPNSKK
ncbi:MAG TPA: HAMP domain-containing sensor histidine kinase [Patescibacteria group bacterium]|nr:HAMP domain-containing sensor histidine kinase [Patescibacteria group bacterium]